MRVSNRPVTITENKELVLRKKIKTFFKRYILEGEQDPCPVKDHFAPAVDKWSMFVLYYLAYTGTLRFGKLKNMIPGISSRMLSLTLKKLERMKLLTRKVYPEVPPKVEYSLTTLGYGFADRLLDLNIWLSENS